MPDILERNDIFPSMKLPQHWDVMSVNAFWQYMHLAGSTCSFHGIGKRTAFSTAVKNVKALTDLRLFHEVNDDESVALVRKFMLLLYGQKAKIEFFK